MNHWRYCRHHFVLSVTPCWSVLVSSVSHISLMYTSPGLFHFNPWRHFLLGFVEKKCFFSSSTKETVSLPCTSAWHQLRFATLNFSSGGWLRKDKTKPGSWWAQPGAMRRDHMRSPSCRASVWSACQGLLSGCGRGRGTGNKLAFLTLAQVFSSTPPSPVLPPPLPTAPATSRSDNTPLLSTVRGLCDMKGSPWGLTWEIGQPAAAGAAEMIGGGENCPRLHHGAVVCQRKTGGQRNK